ncbi:acyl-CoA dehydrogenase family protein [Desulfallas sp. Bu1-1]|uniref:acyl-CoA dehydrogenase family protein n=1 Tax=Desulfallas sp. Bu1-1 TaxID=2787620 RepID=UPI00189FDCD2|nr:acyl-CoA dehydrogenase family protein [Desulfallas sp. Bu1-1]MBF7082845.1 acyl-CoA dehydrogenase family protein [Desulfallas sp. Bu1-1]
MDFELTDEMKMLKDMAFKFAQTEITPISAQCDREEKYTPEIRKKAAELGLVGAWIPEQYGGAGAGILGHTIITEQLSRIDMGIATNIITASFGCEAIYLYGTEEQKETYLPPVCRGEWVSAGAFTEPNAGTDVAGYKTRAVRDGNDFIINGNKMFITNGTVCDFMVVQAITKPEEKRHNRFSQIIVHANSEGITRNKLHGKLGIRASDTAEIVFENVRVPQSNLVGKDGNGFRQLMHFFDVTRMMVAGQALGLSQACLDAAVKYAKERTAFGNPIGSYQATMTKLTEMAIKIESLRNLVYKAAWLIDIGKPDFTLSAMAKYLGGQTAVFCANAAVEIHGGYGYMEEYSVQKWYRDAKILELYEGTKEAEIMAIGRVLQSQ